jgi:hypothetical protein
MPWVRWRTGLVLVLASARALAEPPSPPAAGDPEVPAESAVPASPEGYRLFPEFSRDDVHGFVWTRYRLRATNHESDQDAYQNLLLDVGDPKKSRVTLSLLASWSADLDGHGRRNALFSVQDTFSDPINGRLLHAYVDVHRLGPVERVRGGRQTSALFPEVPLFDGVSIESRAFTSWNWRFRAFAGVPTHLYESSPSGDSIFGGGVETEPAAGTWAALHAARIRDALVLSTETDTLVALEASQRLWRDVLLAGRATSADENVRDLTARASYAGTDLGLRAQLSYFTLVKTQRQLVTELDPFFSIIREERPYHEWRVLVSKDFGERWTVEGGAWLRELDEDSDESAFNHEFRRFFVTPALHDWPLEGTHASVTAELWEAEDQAVRTYGFDLTQDIGKRVRASVGSEYALFKFSPFFGEEREQVRSVYLRGSADLTSTLRADVALSLESDDRDTYRTLLVGLRWRF